MDLAQGNSEFLELNSELGGTPIEVPSPIREKIRGRAYERYQQRGCTDGLDLEDWLEAEREILQGEILQEAWEE